MGIIALLSPFSIVPPLSPVRRSWPSDETARPPCHTEPTTMPPATKRAAAQPATMCVHKHGCRRAPHTYHRDVRPEALCISALPCMRYL